MRFSKSSGQRFLKFLVHVMFLSLLLSTTNGIKILCDIL